MLPLSSPAFLRVAAISEGVGIRLFGVSTTLLLWGQFGARSALLVLALSAAAAGTTALVGRVTTRFPAVAVHTVAGVLLLVFRAGTFAATLAGSLPVAALMFCLSNGVGTVLMSAFKVQQGPGGLHQLVTVDAAARGVAALGAGMLVTLVPHVGMPVVVAGSLAGPLPGMWRAGRWWARPDVTVPAARLAGGGGPPWRAMLEGFVLVGASAGTVAALPVLVAAAGSPAWAGVPILLLAAGQQAVRSPVVCRRLDPVWVRLAAGLGGSVLVLAVGGGMLWLVAPVVVLLGAVVTVTMLRTEGPAASRGARAVAAVSASRQMGRAVGTFVIALLA